MKKISGNAQKAKLTALKEAHKMAKDMMGEDLKGLKKVTVAAPDKKGLEMGLKKAEELVDASQHENDEESDEHESMESEDEEKAEHEMGGSEYGEEEDEMLAHCDSPEEIDQMIAKLQEKKKKLQA